MNPVLRTFAVALACAAGVLAPPPAWAEEISLKVENYVFAASEALADGEPALALSLLRRAKSEEPDCCIVDEYLCRCYAALGNLDMAREAYASFVGCMKVSDEGVLAELDAVIAQASEAAKALEAAQAEQAAATQQASAPATEAASAHQPVTADISTQPSQGGGGGGTLGWALLGSGAAIGIGGGVASVLTWNAGQGHVEENQQAAYEGLLPWNHVAVIGAGVGGAAAVTGLVLGIRGARGKAAAVSAAPWVPSQGVVGLQARVEVP